jgi:hypothetical protein
VSATVPQAKRLVLFSLIVAGGTAAGNHVLRDELPPMRIAFGIVGSAVLLGGLAEAAPGIAGMLAIAIAVSTVFVTGGPFWTAAAKLLEDK